MKALGWKLPYFCDADHITLRPVERFLAPCDFFTIDVADFIGQPAQAGRHRELREAASGTAGQHSSWQAPIEAFEITAASICGKPRRSFSPR